MTKEGHEAQAPKKEDYPNYLRHSLVPPTPRYPDMPSSSEASKPSSDQSGDSDA